MRSLPNNRGTISPSRPTRWILHEESFYSAILYAGWNSENSSATQFWLKNGFCDRNRVPRPHHEAFATFTGQALGIYLHHLIDAGDGLAPDAHFLKVKCRSNCNLVVIKRKRIQHAVVLAVEIIHAGTPESGDRNVNRRFDEKVVVTSRRTHSFDRVEVIGIFVTSRKTQVNALEQALADADRHIGRSEILTGEESGIERTPAGAQCNISAVERLVAKTDIENR